jgi:hypothetical protein
VLVDFCTSNIETYHRFSEFPVLKWAVDLVLDAALIEKELILNSGICAWKHEPAEFAVFSLKVWRSTRALGRRMGCIR